MYTHVSSKLIAQTKSPLDLLNQQANGEGIVPAPVKRGQKALAEQTPQVERPRPARGKIPRKQQANPPKKVRRQRPEQRKKGRKPR
jgi:hypothetical protein